MGKFTIDVTGVDISIDGPGVNFLGSYATSPNGRYVVAWSIGPFYGKDFIPGSGIGYYLLLEGREIVSVGTRAETNEAAVSDDGTVALCSQGSTPARSKFWVVDKTDKVLLKQPIRAYIGDCGISADGRYAICQAADSESDDANKLHLFNVTSGERLAAWEPETGCHRKTYSFDTEKMLVRLHYEGWEPLAYTFDGTFIDHEKYRQQTIEHGSAYDLWLVASKMIEELPAQPTPEQGKEIMLVLRAAGEREGANEMMARLTRAAGELYEAYDAPARAVACYERALGIDAKVGCKRKMDSLKRRLKMIDDE